MTIDEDIAALEGADSPEEATSPRRRLELPGPATGFIDAFPVGNGRLGAMVHGRPGTERLDLNVDTLWSGGPVQRETGEPKNVLIAPLREAIRERDFLRADELARALQGPGYTQSYQPLGRLDWSHADDDGGTGYSRHLDLAAAEAVAEYETAAGAVRMTTFVSAPDNVLVSSITGGGSRSGALRFTSEHPGVSVTESESDDAQVTWLVATGRAPAQVYPNYVSDADPAVVYASDEPDRDGLVDAGMGFAVVAAVHRVGAHDARVVVAAESGFRGYDSRPSADLLELAARARATVVAALERGADEIVDRHRADYSSYFERVSLELNDIALDEEQHAENVQAKGDPRAAALYFDFGRYLLISSSRPGTETATLQGIWNTDVRPGWSSNYTANINVEMNYWPAERVGLGELHTPVFELAADLADAGRSTAERYYGARGSAVHHNTDIWRFSTPVIGDPQWSNWSSGLMWLAADLWEHLEFGGDWSAHGETALSVHRAAADFALDMLVPDSEGRLEMSPSSSPELRFLVDATADAAVAAGSAMDQELVHEILTRFIALAAVSTAHPADPADADRVSRAHAALEVLRAPLIGRGGDLLEWSDERPPREPGHRHVSHLYGLFPGTRITETTTPEYFEAAREALRMRLEAGTGYTGWSQAWLLCLAARLRDPELAETSIAILAGDLSSDSLLDLHPHQDWPGGYIFQIDGNLGAVAGMAELLVQSHEGAVALLKTLPGSWQGGRVRGLRARGGHSVDVAWAQHELVDAHVTAATTGELVVDVACPVTAVTVTDAAGETMTVSPGEGAAPGRARFSWLASAGGRYRIEPVA